MDYETKGNLAIIPFATKQAWEEWLELNHRSSAGLWLKIAKKNANTPSITYAEALDVAICYGWIDGQKAAYDEQFWLQRFTPRRPRSKWSKRNKEKAHLFISQGLMKPAGLEEVNAAQADGRWDAAYDSQTNATIPEDLQKKLDENPEAKDLFNGLSSKQRYSILYHIQDAKRPETRAARIEKYIAELNFGTQTDL